MTTPRQQQILDYIREYIAENHRPPTLREIGARFGFVHQAAHSHLIRMERAGLIRREYGISRGIEIL